MTNFADEIITTSAEVPIKKNIVLADGGDRKLSHLPYRNGALHGVKISDTFFAADLGYVLCSG